MHLRNNKTDGLMMTINHILEDSIHNKTGLNNFQFDSYAPKLIEGYTQQCCVSDNVSHPLLTGYYAVVVPEAECDTRLLLVGYRSIRSLYQKAALSISVGVETTIVWERLGF
jgi:hypothetical protein